MTDKKLTDEEIIKALHEMWGCSYNYEECQQHLINRQKAEIERLKECPKCVYEYDGETTEYCVQGPCANFKTVEQVKTEAYKEFAERLKEKYGIFTPLGVNWIEEVKVVRVSDIDKILKEMVGE